MGVIKALQPAREMKAAPGRGLSIAALIVAGESVFLLPFVLARVFRPTFLDVFGLTNLELGTAYSVYGIVAMAAYFFGGPLADKFRARTMLAVALTSTAAGGLVMMRVPPLSTLVILYAYWGITTIALFWAPLIRATREWGSDDSQGRAFGLLDGGRGLLAAVMGSFMVTLFAALLPADSDYPAVVRHNVWSRPAGLASAPEARFVTARRGATIGSEWYCPRVRHAVSLVTGGDYSVCVCWL